MTHFRPMLSRSWRSPRCPSRWLMRGLAWGLAVTSLSTLLASCSAPSSPPEAATPAPTAAPAAAPTPEAAETLGKIKFKGADGAEAFSLKLKADGAKLVDGADAELARLTVDGAQKVKIKDASDRVLGYVVPESDHWKVETPDQGQELFILRRQGDGDYKLEDGQDTLIYRIKRRDYGYEIESAADQSLYKIKVKDGKTSLRNPQEETVLSTKDAIAPIAMACFGFDALTPAQRAALALTLNTAGD